MLIVSIRSLIYTESGSELPFQSVSREETLRMCCWLLPDQECHSGQGRSLIQKRPDRVTGHCCLSLWHYIYISVTHQWFQSLTSRQEVTNTHTQSHCSANNSSWFCLFPTHIHSIRNIFMYNKSNRHCMGFFLPTLMLYKPEEKNATVAANRIQ